MDFNDIAENVQNDIAELLNEHLHASVNILKDDGFLEPMLMINGSTPESSRLISLQPANGETDVDKAYALTVSTLKDSSFTYAIFSYSTELALSRGKPIKALKTCVFNQSGLAVTFFSPYQIKGIFKKTVTLGKTVLAEVTEKAF